MMFHEVSSLILLYYIYMVLRASLSRSPSAKRHRFGRKEDGFHRGEAHLVLHRLGDAIL